MLKQLQDLTIATYNDPTQLQAAEIKQADLVKIRGFYPGGMYHSHSVVWKGYLPENIEPLQRIRSKSERKAMKRNLAHLAANNYQVKTTLLNEELYKEFLRIYDRTIAKKKRPMKYNLDEQVRAKLLIKKDVYIAGLWQGEKLNSGLIFSVKNNEVVVSVGAKEKIPGLKGGIGGILELELFKFCRENNLQYISHGKGTNPTGITTPAGVFEFKVRHGFTAFPSEYWKTTFIRSTKIAISNLIFVGLKNNMLCYFVVSQEDPAILKKKYLANEIELLEIINPAEIEKQYTDLLASITA